MIDSPLPTSPPVIGQSMMTDSSLATPTLALSVGLGLEMQKNVVPRRREVALTRVLVRLRRCRQPHAHTDGLRERSRDHL